jgi:flagellar basal body-associated protein FliL
MSKIINHIARNGELCIVLVLLAIAVYAVFAIFSEHQSVTQQKSNLTIIEKRDVVTATQDFTIIIVRDDKTGIEYVANSSGGIVKRD